MQNWAMMTLLGVAKLSGLLDSSSNLLLRYMASVGSAGERGPLR